MYFNHILCNARDARESLVPVTNHNKDKLNLAGLILVSIN